MAKLIKMAMVVFLIMMSVNGISFAQDDDGGDAGGDVSDAGAEADISDAGDVSDAGDTVDAGDAEDRPDQDQELVEETRESYEEFPAVTTTSTGVVTTTDTAYIRDRGTNVVGAAVAGAAIGAGAGAAAGSIATVKTARDGSVPAVLQTAVGKDFAIILDANATTGYEWQLAKPVDDSLVKFVGSEYVQDKTGLVGSGGKSIWTFSAIRAGKARLSFKYIRPWEKRAKPVKEATYIVNIQE